MRCDTCAAQAAQAPQDVASLLVWLAPPLELVEALERWQASAEAKAWADAQEILIEM
jgi:hypothetical protein